MEIKVNRPVSQYMRKSWTINPDRDPSAPYKNLPDKAGLTREQRNKIENIKHAQTYAEDDKDLF